MEKHRIDRVVAFVHLPIAGAAETPEYLNGKKREEFEIEQFPHKEFFEFYKLAFEGMQFHFRRDGSLQNTLFIYAGYRREIDSKFSEILRKGAKNVEVFHSTGPPPDRYYIEKLIQNFKFNTDKVELIAFGTHRAGCVYATLSDFAKELKRKFPHIKVYAENHGIGESVLNLKRFIKTKREFPGIKISLFPRDYRDPRLHFSRSAYSLDSLYSERAIFDSYKEPKLPNIYANGFEYDRYIERVIENYKHTQKMKKWEKSEEKRKAKKSKKKPQRKRK